MDKIQRLANSGYKTNKGIFTPKNPAKYIGNVDNIVYMSGWELKVMTFLDTHPDVIEWASEEFSIPYLSPVDRKVHKYYPDFFVKRRGKTGKIESMVLEVKPRKQIEPPMVPKKQSPKYIKEAVTYAVNSAKWEAAQAFCEKNKMKFLILTEEDIFKKGF